VGQREVAPGVHITILERPRAPARAGQPKLQS
jgi:hypothetical protein